LAALNIRQRKFKFILMERCSSLEINDLIEVFIKKSLGRLASLNFLNHYD